MAINRRTATADAPSADDYAPETPAQSDGDFTPEDDYQPERSSTVSRRGWGNAKNTLQNTASKFESEFKVTDDDQLIKFVEDEPFWSGASHWVDEIREGKRSFFCLEDECPLCGVGHAPRAQVWFNVVPVSKTGKPEMLVLKAGPLLTKLIEKEHEDRYGPISRHYWRISKSGGGKKGGKVNYNLSPVKAADLVDDGWADDPQAVAAAIESLKPYDESVVKFTSREDLEQVVQQHLLDD